MKKTKKTRLRIETLEDRCCPAIIWWQGDADNYWNNSGNWEDDQVPGINDDVVLASIVSGGFQPWIQENETFQVKSLNVAMPFAGETLTIDGKLELHGFYDPIEDHASYFHHAATIAGSGALQVVGHFFWGGGTLDLATIDVNGINSRFFVGFNAEHLLVDEVNIENGGRMVLGGSGGGLVPMNGNLITAEDTVIDVNARSKLFFIQEETDFGSKGGFAQQTDVGSYIIVGGEEAEVIREGSIEDVFCGLPIFVEDEGKLILEYESYLRFTDITTDVTPSVYLDDGGQLILSPYSTLVVDDGLIVGGGAIITLGDFDYSTTAIEGNVRVNSGHVYVTADGQYGTLEVFGNLDIYGGTFHMSIAGAFAACDSVACTGGTMYLDANNTAKLEVHSEVVPNPTAEYLLFSGITNDLAFDADFSDFAWLGEYGEYARSISEDGNHYRLTP